MCSIRCIKSSIYIWRRTSLGLFVIENMGTPALCARKKKFLFHSGLCLETAEMCHLFQTRYIFTPKSNKCVLISMHSWVNSCKAQNFFFCQPEHVVLIGNVWKVVQRVINCALGNDRVGSKFVLAPRTST